MKTFKCFALVAFFSLFIISCSKNERLNTGDETSDLPTCNVSHNTSEDDQNSTPSNANENEQDQIPSNISFCSEKTVSICTAKENVGNLTVKRGSDDKIYVTYLTNGNFYLRGVSLYTGTSNRIPIVNKEVNICDFPYKKSINSNSSHQYTFVLRNQPASFAIAAYASVAKKHGNSLTAADNAWADGCSGQLIYDPSQHGNNDEHGVHDTNNNTSDCKGGKWATWFTFSGAACAAAAPAAPPEPVAEPDICSRPIPCFFGINPVYNSVTPWIVPDITVAGYTYTEEEGRAIANTVDINNVVTDSKYAFIRVATLKLSNTDYNLSPTLGPAVSTVEAWLSHAGKISPTNLPAANQEVKNAETFINNWIDLHNCPGRR